MKAAAGGTAFPGHTTHRPFQGRPHWTVSRRHRTLNNDARISSQFPANGRQMAQWSFRFRVVQSRTAVRLLSVFRSVFDPRALPILFRVCFIRLVAPRSLLHRRSRRFETFRRHQCLAFAYPSSLKKTAANVTPGPTTDVILLLLLLLSTDQCAQTGLHSFNNRIPRRKRYIHRSPHSGEQVYLRLFSWVNIICSIMYYTSILNQLNDVRLRLNVLQMCCRVPILLLHYMRRLKKISKTVPDDRCDVS